MKKTLLYTVATAALMIPGAAFAQSTGSIDFDEGSEIVVTGASVNDGVAGVVVPDTTKAKAVLNQEFIARQTPGQSVNDIINQLPGVSFQNNDPFGSAGGTMTIRGFDNTRISQTFDGVPLNDSGGYAIYSSQQLDSELIEQVNVNLGTTDVDSPTAAASGSTVNYRTRNPTDEFSVKAVGSVGDSQFFRIFGSVDTGVFTAVGTKAFFAASKSTNDVLFSNRGIIDKMQLNAKVYQPLGDNGDFISVAAHYNEARNNRFGSVTFRDDSVGAVPSRFPNNRDERDYVIPYCTTTMPAIAGTADAATSCGSTFDERLNPSNTGNIRVNSRFTLADGLVLSVDPSFQYVRANGGGTAVGREGFRDINPTGGTGTCGTAAGAITPAIYCSAGYLAGSPYFGRDLNGDGDSLDSVRVAAPSETNTRRYGLISSLRYDINDQHTVRIAYSLDYARHRQTGEVNFLAVDGQQVVPFPETNNPLQDVTGAVLQKRDRLSKAILNQVSGEYRGQFGALTVNAGVRAPFFKRDLTNYCATSSATGFVECFGSNAAGATQYGTLNPAIQGPQRRVLKYNKVLPNVGLVFDVASSASVFGNYSKGVQVPGTDNLYNSFFFAANTPSANPSPETTDNFDVGVRYRTSRLQAQASVWYTKYSNRLASAYDPETDRTLYRNLGQVDKYGVDGSISYRPTDFFSLYAFGSYLKSKIKDNVLYGECTALNAAIGCTAIGQEIFAQTAGKRESGSPVYTFGGRAQANLGFVELGVQAKRTGPRYVNDLNQPFTLGGTISGGVATGGTQVYGAKAPAYTLVDLDLRLSAAPLGLGDKTYFQLNVTNVFDKLYVGGFDGRLDSGFVAASNLPFVQIGAPRTFIGSVVIGF
ncbi:TonB-dependent receptor [Sphingobium boeckii]|uniref:Iron complex outermembrane receptor protein n=1 Tax=Sphingobium boeckii TaxID=1082345 RepID=A0A7W9AKX7_9SPHN|nr:TonB-dependent receptor [Sphingobium boeckii]MBB5687578.1 iron complex outermembrane receptor protein [Sphingobium boeckii]